MKVVDLSVFEFGGTSSNFSFRVESKDMMCRVTNRTTKERLSKEAEAKGVKGICCRAVVVPDTPFSLFLWLAVVSLSMGP